MHIIGSKWFKVDFHCHSPASDDFPRNRDQEKCSYREWLIGHMSQEIDCVVLSDHNTAAGLEPIRKEGEFKHEVRQFQKPYDNQQAEQISLMV